MSDNGVLCQVRSGGRTTIGALIGRGVIRSSLAYDDVDAILVEDFTPEVDVGDGLVIVNAAKGWQVDIDRTPETEGLGWEVEWFGVDGADDISGLDVQLVEGVPLEVARLVALTAARSGFAAAVDVLRAFGAA